MTPTPHGCTQHMSKAGPGECAHGQERQGHHREGVSPREHAPIRVVASWIHSQAPALGASGHEQQANQPTCCDQERHPTPVRAMVQIPGPPCSAATQPRGRADHRDARGFTGVSGHQFYHESDIEMAVHGQRVPLVRLRRGALRRGRAAGGSTSKSGACDRTRYARRTHHPRAHTFLLAGRSATNRCRCACGILWTGRIIDHGASRGQQKTLQGAQTSTILNSSLRLYMRVDNTAATCAVNTSTLLFSEKLLFGSFSA